MSPPKNKDMNARTYLLNNRGQSIVEITLITPLLLAALYVVMDFGILFFTSQYAQNAVREAARVGSILPDCDTGASPCVTTVAAQACPGTSPVVREACDRLPNRLNGPNVAVVLTGDIGSACMREVEVSLSGSYNFGLYNVMALVGWPLASKTLPLARSAVAYYQGQPVTGTGKC
jgi:hypothetical protein